MKKPAALALLAITLFALSGCGKSESSPEVLNSRKTVSPNPNYSKSVFIDDMRLEIATLKDTFPTDEIVPLRISVTNTGDKEDSLTYSSGKKYDFTVTDAAGSEVWRWSSGRMFTQEIITVKIKPAENYNFFGRVEAGFLKPGDYTAKGWITAEELAGEKISIRFKVKTL